MKTVEIVAGGPLDGKTFEVGDESTTVIITNHGEPIFTIPIDEEGRADWNDRVDVSVQTCACPKCSLCGSHDNLEWDDDRQEWFCAVCLC